MAWTCTGKSNDELVILMRQNGIFHSDRVSTAMLKVDRANYVVYKGTAYQDAPQSIGHGATISAPHMHAHAAEHLLPFLRPGAKVLDVGSGSGYLSAVLYHLISEGGAGKLIGIDHVPELVDWSEGNLRKDGLGPALDSKQIEMVTGDGRLGYPQAGPYDAIHVGAAAPTLPSALVDQLASPGRMFIPIGTDDQRIFQVDKDANGVVTQKDMMGVLVGFLLPKIGQLNKWHAQYVPPRTDHRPIKSPSMPASYFIFLSLTTPTARKLRRSFRTGSPSFLMSGLRSEYSSPPAIDPSWVQR